MFYRYFSYSYPSARGYALSGAGRGARAGYAAFIFEGCSIFLLIANFPLEFTSKLNGVGREKEREKKRKKKEKKERKRKKKEEKRKRKRRKK